MTSGPMRQGSNNQSNRRGRGRGHNHNNHGRRHHNNQGGGNRNQTFDSNGPSGRIRGNAKQLFEKYQQLAKDAISSGDRVLAEGLYQHADHYGRIYAQFAPKPKPAEEPASPAVEAESQKPEAADAAVEPEAAKTDDVSVSVEIEDGDKAESAPVEAEAPKAAEEEKPKRRAPRKTTTRKRAPKEDPNAPKLGGGSNAVPDFLARPVSVEGEETAPEAKAEEEEKPKRRAPRKTTTRKTTTTRTRRKKADADPVAEDTEKEAS